MNLLAQEEINLEVFRRYAGLSLPRHVSYPMPTGWNPMIGDDFVKMLQTSQQRFPQRHWSLYLHIPFCEALCKFCACNRIILPKKYGDTWQEPTRQYVDILLADLHRLAGVVNSGRQLRQIHWGGGSPTFLPLEQIEQISNTIRQQFNLADDAEISMEIDPRHTSPELLQLLRRLGFNRLSMGIQDFDAQAQEHVKRVQPFEMVRAVVQHARSNGFDSINFDLIYGMPYQTVETIRNTVELAIQLHPDRVAYYHYAQIPHKIATQRGMDYTRLPTSEEKLQMFIVGHRLFTRAGYDFIGLDHFARQSEGLAHAAEEGTLQRNFQGMTTGGGLDLIGVGVSAISHFLEVGFTQNEKEVEKYQQMAGEKRWTVDRGKWFTPDDLIRQAVIHDIYCSAEIVPQRVEQRFGINFDDYFARERSALEVVAQDGLLLAEPDGRWLITYPLGRVLMRNVAAIFDAYLDPEAYRQGDRDYFSANA
ncbi:MAG: Oxygen-independent coproporphyrinogen III oxidase [Phycisphaerae bacterium]|nr:Oxygen-independent coproporphyrinogen III oxidase [Phycisphaerae bacterium]